MQFIECKYTTQPWFTAQKNNVIVMSDEIYTELQFDGKYDSISKFYPEGTIISSGLSKWCGAGGWRLGFFVIPEKLKKVTCLFL